MTNSRCICNNIDLYQPISTVTAPKITRSCAAVRFDTRTMNCLFPCGEFFNVVFRQRLPLCSSEPQSADAASFGSSILFGQPLCSESRQAVLIHFGSLSRIPQNAEPTVCRMSCRRTKHTSRDSSCRPWRPLPGCSMKRNRISMIRCFGLASQGGRVDIADYSALSRAMEEGFRRFRMSPPAFGIFNRIHNHESAERITRTIS